jgi:tRNA threonylcarbamoyladenosine biosynthesis protein TsaB
VIDARRGEVYAAIDGAEMVCGFPALLARLGEGRVEFISQNFEPFQAQFAATGFAACPVVTAPQALAAMVARIAEERLAAGDAGDPAGLDANYVRRSDAELLFKAW